VERVSNSILTSFRINQFLAEVATPLPMMQNLGIPQELARPPLKARRAQKQFRCPVPGCSANYTRRHNLKTHFRNNHKGCEAKFPGIFATLKSTKEGKKWKCPVRDCICGYSRKGDLKHHFALKHPRQVEMYPDICKPKSSKDNKNYLCPISHCNCGYMRKSDLKNHISLKHPEEMHLFPELLPHDATSQFDETDDSTISTYEPYPAQESDHSGFEVPEEDDEEFDGRSLSDPDTDPYLDQDMDAVAYYSQTRHDAGSSLVDRSSTLLESDRPCSTYWSVAPKPLSLEEISVATCLAFLAEEK